MLLKQFFPIQVRGFKPKVRLLLLILYGLLSRKHLIVQLFFFFFSAAEVKPLEEGTKCTVCDYAAEASSLLVLGLEGLGAVRHLL